MSNFCNFLPNLHFHNFRVHKKRGFFQVWPCQIFTDKITNLVYGKTWKYKIHGTIKNVFPKELKGKGQRWKKIPACQQCWCKFFS